MSKNTKPLKLLTDLPLLLLAPQSGAHRLGAIPIPFIVFEPVHTEAFKPVSGSMWQSVVLLDRQ